MSGGSLHLEDSEVSSCSADSGAALRVTSGEAAVFNSSFEDNAAVLDGGAVKVEGGSVVLANHTKLKRNRAGSGNSIMLQDGGKLSYALPAPLAHWVFITDHSLVSWLSSGAVDAEYPFTCSAGLVGDTYDSWAQSGPLCASPCPAGHSCAAATVVPKMCNTGTYCPTGSAAPIDCPAGFVGRAPKLEFASQCDVCRPGGMCPAGSANETPCALGTHAPSTQSARCSACPAGKYPDVKGQTGCKECPPSGHFCPAGSAAPVACLAGTWSSTSGLSSREQCTDCPMGSFCGEGVSQPHPCPAGSVGRQHRLGDVSDCLDCPYPTTSAVGSSVCAFCQEAHYLLQSANSSAAVDVTDCLPCATRECLDDECPFRCPLNTTIETLSLSNGYWQHSTATEQVWRCRSSGGWSPCQGGNIVGNDGDGCDRRRDFNPHTLVPLGELWRRRSLSGLDSVNLCDRLCCRLPRPDVRALQLDRVVLAVLRQARASVPRLRQRCQTGNRSVQCGAHPAACCFRRGSWPSFAPRPVSS